MFRTQLPSRSRFLQHGWEQSRSGPCSSEQPRRMLSSGVTELPSPSNYATLAAVPDTNATLEHVFREEYGRIIATLIRISGSFDLAEEALQEAFTSATSMWENEGTPHSPGAWLTTVAHRKLIDAIRRDKTRNDKQAEVAFESTRLQPYAELELPEETV